MSVHQADVTAFFERSALKLNVSPQRLAVLVNGFEKMALRDWDSVSDVDGVEMADIEKLRAQLFELSREGEKPLMSVAIAQTCCEHGVEFVDRGCTGAEIKMIKEGRFPRPICSL